MRGDRETKRLIGGSERLKLRETPFDVAEIMTIWIKLTHRMADQRQTNSN